MDKYKPDFKRIYELANNVLVTSSTIFDIPIDIKTHIKEETDITLCTYEKAIEKYNVLENEFKSDDAELQVRDGRYVIYYKKNKNPRRIKWSIAHELGHFYANHELDASETDMKLYEKQEVEANFFAAQLLMPDQILWCLIERGIQANTIDVLYNLFGVSEQAAKNRLSTLRKQKDYDYDFIDHSYDSDILLKFKSFIDMHTPKYRIDSYEDEEEMQKERDTWYYR